MDYRRIYREFIADRKGKRKPECYTERHHIVPRSLGGSDDVDNLIDLTAEDHFFAHLLLAKIHGGMMWQAVCRMRWGRLSGDRPWVRGRPMYGLARRNMAVALSERFSGQDGKKGSDNGRYDGTDITWTNVDTGEALTATKWEMWRRFGGNRGSWTMAAIGQRKTFRGWSPYPEAVLIRSGKGRIFKFINRDGRTFEGRQGDFAKSYGLSAASVSRITRRGDVTLCGWRLQGQHDRQLGQTRDGSFAWQHRKAEKQKRGVTA